MVSGAPSTVWAIARHEDPLAATRAAGQLLVQRGDAVLFAAGAVHAAMSLGWAGVLARVMPERLSAGRAAAFGAAAGAVIATIDLTGAHVAPGQRWAGVRDLPVAPQLADHVAFGVCVALVLARADAQINAMASAIESSTRPGR